MKLNRIKSITEMILNVINAEYISGFKVQLTFNTGESVLTDLEETLFSDSRKIFAPLRDLDYFRNFKIKLNTITWDNEADFAPEFLLEKGKQQEIRISEHPTSKSGT